MITTTARGSVVRNLGRADRWRGQNDWKDEWESETWLDSRKFKNYAFEVLKVLLAADHPLCTREIHAALGEKANPRWTQDALEAIRNIEKVGILPTRYRIMAGELRQPKKLDQDAEHDRIFEN